MAPVLDWQDIDRPSHHILIVVYNTRFRLRCPRRYHRIEVPITRVKNPDAPSAKWSDLTPHHFFAARATWSTFPVHLLLIALVSHCISRVARPPQTSGSPLLTSSSPRSTVAGQSPAALRFSSGPSQARIGLSSVRSCGFKFPAEALAAECASSGPFDHHCLSTRSCGDESADSPTLQFQIPFFPALGLSCHFPFPGRRRASSPREEPELPDPRYVTDATGTYHPLQAFRFGPPLVHISMDPVSSHCLHHETPPPPRLL